MEQEEKIKPPEASLRRSARNEVPPSPGRRCEPHHHDAEPGPSSLKDAKKERAIHAGFYSAAELKFYLHKDNKLRRRRSRGRKVAWSKQLEW